MFYIHNIYSVYIYMVLKKDIIKRSFIEETPELQKVNILTNQRSLCPVGTCVKRSLSHIRTSPKIIVSSWHLR